MKIIHNKIKFNNHISATKTIVKMKTTIVSKTQMIKMIVKTKIVNNKVVALLQSNPKITRSGRCNSEPTGEQKWIIWWIAKNKSNRIHFGQSTKDISGTWMQTTINYRKIMSKAVRAKISSIAISDRHSLNTRRNRKRERRKWPINSMKTKKNKRKEEQS